MDYVEIPIDDGSILRVLYEVTIGDLLITTSIAALIFFLILDALRKLIWRR